MCNFCNEFYDHSASNSDLRLVAFNLDSRKTAAALGIAPGAALAMQFCQAGAAAQAIVGALLEVPCGKQVSLESLWGGEIDGGESQPMWFGMYPALAMLIESGVVTFHGGAPLSMQAVISLPASGYAAARALLSAEFPVSD